MIDKEVLANKYLQKIEIQQVLTKSPNSKEVQNNFSLSSILTSFLENPKLPLSKQRGATISL